MRLAWQCRHAKDFEAGCERCVMHPQARPERMLESMASMIHLWARTLVNTAELDAPAPVVRQVLMQQVEHLLVAVGFASVCADGLGARRCPLRGPLTRMMQDLSSSLVTDDAAVTMATRHLRDVVWAADHWCETTAQWTNMEIGDADG